MSALQQLLSEVSNNQYRDEVLSLVFLDINDENISNLCDALQKNTYIKKVDLKNHSLGDEAAKILSSVIKTGGIEELDLSGNEISSIGADYLSKSELVKLNLSSNPLGDEGVIALSKSQHLIHLNVSDCDITDRGAEELFKSTGIVKLDLSMNQVSDEGVKMLLENQILQELNLSHNLIGNQGAKLIAKSNLKVIFLSHNLIGDEGISAFEQSKCVELKLGSNNIGDNGFLALCRNNTIERLSVPRNNISLHDVARLPENTKITSLCLSYNHIDDISEDSLKGLISFPKLKFLDLSNNELSDKGARFLLKSNFKAKNSSLEQITLRGNRISDQNLITFALNKIKRKLPSEENTSEKNKLRH